MSGLNEQMPLEFPDCPNSGCRPFERFWIGYREGNKNDVFFNSEEYLHENIIYRVPIYDNTFEEGRMATIEELDEVVGIKCNSCSGLAGMALFSDIIIVAKRLVEEYNNVRNQ